MCAAIELAKGARGRDGPASGRLVVHSDWMGSHGDVSSGLVHQASGRGPYSRSRSV